MNKTKGPFNLGNQGVRVMRFLSFLALLAFAGCASRPGQETNRSIASINGSRDSRTYSITEGSRSKWIFDVASGGPSTIHLGGSEAAKVYDSISDPGHDEINTATVSTTYTSGAVLQPGEVLGKLKITEDGTIACYRMSNIAAIQASLRGSSSCSIQLEPGTGRIIKQNYSY
jgi:hypothetical protein